MTDVLESALRGFDWFVILYFVVLNSWYLVLIVLAGFEARRHFRSAPFTGLDELFASPLTPAVSIIVPAHNEQAGIVESVRALMALKYPAFEIIVVEDGSTDATFDVLRDAFGLVEVPKVIPDEVPTIGEVHSVHRPTNGESLVVVRKTSARRKSDALNAGINVAQNPLLSFIDADALLDEEAVLRVAQPFVDDPLRVVASGGCIRPVNGSTVYRGRVVDARMPADWLARIQVVEYLRSFLMGRAGWSRLQGLLVISGAFGLFRRDVVVQVGGFDLSSIGEDAELVAHIHREMRRQRRPYRIVFVPEPVCWTEVPATRAALGLQRRRWTHGLADTLWKHRVMIANPRYGRMGLLVLPFFLVFELLSPIVELLGVVAVALGLALGVVDIPFALLFLTVAVGYGVFLTLASLAIEELSYRRYRRWSDFGLGVIAAVLENVGFRQMHAWWRFRGLLDVARPRESAWQALPRAGFGTGPDDARVPKDSGAL